MNTQSLTIAAVLSAFAFAAAAAGPTEGSVGNEAVAQSVKTRAEVRAELLDSQKNGSFQIVNEAYATSTMPFVSTRSRADVRAELIAAQKDGSFQVANEAYATSTTPFVNTRSRADVRKEAVMATRNAQPNQSYYVGG